MPDTALTMTPRLTTNLATTSGPSCPIARSVLLSLALRQAGADWPPLHPCQDRESDGYGEEEEGQEQDLAGEQPQLLEGTLPVCGSHSWPSFWVDAAGGFVGATRSHCPEPPPPPPPRVWAPWHPLLPSPQVKTRAAQSCCTRTRNTTPQLPKHTEKSQRRWCRKKMRRRWRCAAGSVGGSPHGMPLRSCGWGACAADRGALHPSLCTQRLPCCLGCSLAQVPIVAPVKPKKFEVEEREALTTRYSSEFLNTLLATPKLARNAAVVGHLHHGKTLVCELQPHTTVPRPEQAGLQPPFAQCAASGHVHRANT